MNVAIIVTPIQVNSATHEWPTVRKCERAKEKVEQQASEIARISDTAGVF